MEPTAPPQTVFDPQQRPYNGPLPHIYPNLYSPGAPLHDPSLHGKNSKGAVSHDYNLLLTKREGRAGEYWPSVAPVRLELARLVSSLLYGTRAMLVLNLRAFVNKKYTAYDHFHRNGPYGEIPTKKEPIRMFGFAFQYNN